MSKKKDVRDLLLIMSEIWGPFYFSVFRFELVRNGIEPSKRVDLLFLSISVVGWVVGGYLVLRWWLKKRREPKSSKRGEVAHLRPLVDYYLKKERG